MKNIELTPDAKVLMMANFISAPTFPFSRRSSSVAFFIAFLMGVSMFSTAQGAETKDRPKILATQTIMPRIEAVRFASKTLETEKTFCVVFPADFEKQKKGERPFLFLLHGSGRNERTLIDNPLTRQAMLDAGYTIILPDGDSAWYVDSPVNPKAKYATYTEEVLRLAERKYGLSRDPSRRAISGWSMGGYGCVRFAETHPNEFGTLASMIGVIDYPRSSEEFPPGQSYRLRTDCFGDDPEVWKTYNPIYFAEKLKGMSILLITGDVAFDRTMNENFCKELDRLQIPYRFEMLKGAHSPEVVQEAVPLVLEYVRTGLGVE